MRRVILTGILAALLSSLALAQEGENPLVWGPILGAVTEDSIAMTWETSRPVGGDLNYATASEYAATGSWEGTVALDQVKGSGGVEIDGLKPGTDYRYRLVLYEGDTVYESPVGSFTTASDAPFTFLVYGDTRTYPDRHELVADTMAEDEPDAAFVVNTGDLVESPTIGRFRSFFAAIGKLALDHPYLAVIGNHEKGSPRYYRFLALPTGGGKSNEEWWSFDYGPVHFVGIDSNSLTGADAIARMRDQVEWVKEDLTGSDAPFKVVFFHHPIYSSTWDGGVNGPLRDTWEEIFREGGVDIVFNGHMHCYEHFYVHGIHHVVTGGGGAPLQDAMEYVAAGTVFRRYKTLHYIRVTVDRDAIRVDMIPVASVYDDEVHPTPCGRAVDSFTIEAGD